MQTEEEESHGMRSSQELTRFADFSVAQKFHAQLGSAFPYTCPSSDLYRHTKELALSRLQYIHRTGSSVIFLPHSFSLQSDRNPSLEPLC